MTSWHGIMAALLCASRNPPPPLIEVRIRRGQLGFGAIELGVEGVGEVGGLLWPVGGDVARFAGVFAEVEDLAARADDEFAVRFVVGREAGGQGASVADTTGRVMITPHDLPASRQHPLATGHFGPGRALTAVLPSCFFVTALVSSLNS